MARCGRGDKGKFFFPEHYKKLKDDDKPQRFIEEIAKRLSDDLQSEFIIWRLVALEKCVNLSELEHWSLEDVMKANAILDMKYDIEKETYANNSRSSR